MIKTPKPILAKKQETIKGDSPKIIAGKKNLEKGKWKPGQSGNSKGRKPKTFAGIAKQWQREGYHEVTKEQLREAYQRMLVLDEPKLKAIVVDLKQPMTLRIVAKNLLAQKGFDVLEKILDRTHGKATENRKFDGELKIGLADFLRGEIGE